MITRMLERPLVLVRGYLNRQFLTFVLVGGGAAALNGGSRVLFSHWMSFGLAVTCAYAVGILAAFTLNRIYVFPNAQAPISRQASAFVVVNLATFPVIWVTAVVLAHWLLPALGLRRGVDDVAHVIAISLPVFSSFVLHKFVTFRGAAKPRRADDATAMELSASPAAQPVLRGPS